MSYHYPGKMTYVNEPSFRSATDSPCQPTNLFPFCAADGSLMERKPLKLESELGNYTTCRVIPLLKQR